MDAEDFCNNYLKSLWSPYLVDLLTFKIKSTALTFNFSIELQSHTLHIFGILLWKIGNCLHPQPISWFQLSVFNDLFNSTGVCKTFNLYKQALL